jgi:hypothetical protein
MGLTGELPQTVQRAFRIRHGASPDLSVCRQPRIDGVIVARSGTQQLQPAQRDNNEARAHEPSTARLVGTFLLAFSFTTLTSDSTVFGHGRKTSRMAAPAPEKIVL